MQILPIRLLTQSEISKSLKVPRMRLTRLVKAGGIRPDFTTGHHNLFWPERIAEFKKFIGRKA